MIELPGWNDHISVNGFCYSSSMGESPKLSIPLKTSPAPTKGIAPNIFTRNSTATYIKDGLVQTAGIDVPRFQNGRYLCEPAATNILLDSHNMTSYQWDKNAVSVQVSDELGLDLTSAPFKINEIATSDYHYITQNLTTMTAGTVFTQSWFVKAGERDKFQIENYNGIKQDVAWFDLSVPEMFTLTNNSGVASAGIEEIGDGWFIVWLTSKADTFCMARLVLMGDRSTNVYSGDGSSGLFVYGVQLETGAKATSYIPTTTVPMDRVADVLHYNVGDVITQGQGSLYCEFWGGNYAGTVRRILNISDGTNSNRMYLYIKETGGVALVCDIAGTTVVSIGTGTVLSTLNKLMLSYKNNDVRVYLNGVLVGSDTSCTIPTNFTTLSAGCTHDGTLQLNTEIGNIKYFKDFLTEEGIKLTTI